MLKIPGVSPKNLPEHNLTQKQAHSEWTEEGLRAGFVVVRRDEDRYVAVRSGPVVPPAALTAELAALKEAL